MWRGPFKRSGKSESEFRSIWAALLHRKQGLRAAFLRLSGFSMKLNFFFQEAPGCYLRSQHFDTLFLLGCKEITEILSLHSRFIVYMVASKRHEKSNERLPFPHWCLLPTPELQTQLHLGLGVGVGVGRDYFLTQINNWFSFNFLLESFHVCKYLVSALTLLIMSLFLLNSFSEEMLVSMALSDPTCIHWYSLLPYPLHLQPFYCSTMCAPAFCWPSMACSLKFQLQVKEPRQALGLLGMC